MAGTGAAELLLGGIVVLAASVQWLTGMGFPLITVPVLVLMLRADCSLIRLRSPAAQRPVVPARGLAVLDGLVAATMLTMGRLLPAPDRPAFRTALRLSSFIAPGARIIKGRETIDEEWR